MRAKLFNRFWFTNYESFIKCIFSAIFTDLKITFKAWCENSLLYVRSSNVCCVVVSLRKRRLYYNWILVSYRTYRGNDMICRRKRIYALYICTVVLFFVWVEPKGSAKERKRKNKRIDITIAAIMAERIHLFPFRTQKLSFLTPKVLCGTPLGRIGHRRFSFALLSAKPDRRAFFLYVNTAGGFRLRLFI